MKDRLGVSLEGFEIFVKKFGFYFLDSGSL